MSELKLQGILEELGKDVYDISLRLGEGLSVRARQDLLSGFPTSNLEVLHPEETYSIPIFPVGVPLRDEYDLLERVENGLEVLVGTIEEVREQLRGRTQSDGILTLTFDADSPALTEERKAEVRQQVAKAVANMVSKPIDGRMTYLKELSDHLTPGVRNLVRSYISATVHKDRKLVKQDDVVRHVGDLSEIELYAERAIAWKALEQTTSKMGGAFRDDAAYLHSVGADELSGQLSEIASFYEHLSQKATDGHARMSGFLNRVIAAYDGPAKLDDSNMERISSGILGKVAGAHEPRLRRWGWH